MNPQNVYYNDGKPYITTRNSPFFSNLGSSLAGLGSQNTMGSNKFNYLMNHGQIAPLQQQPAAQTPQTPDQLAQLQPFLNHLTSQASDALNGGILGYHPSQMTAAGANPQTFNAPQGTLSNGFANMQGLLGGSNPMMQQWRGY